MTDLTSTVSSGTTADLDKSPSNPRGWVTLTPAPGAGEARPQAVPTAVDLSVLVPTRNEVGNVAVLTERLSEAMTGLGRSWELLFLDDSDDATPDVIGSLSSRHPEISMLHRPRGKRPGGLSGAVVAGFRAARGQVMVVMDGDFQHPPELVRELVKLVRSEYCDVAIASRYVQGASAVGLGGRWRRLVSRACISLAHALVPGTRGVRDPMAGFFAVSRRALSGSRLRPHGFKILMEVLGRRNGLRVAEVPFQMGDRAGGDSKAGAREGLRFIRHLGRLVRPGLRSLRPAATRVASLVPLGGILGVQAWLSYRLIFHDTAFIDEATYLSAGHFLLQSWHSGGPNMHFPTYFSGAPTIYPVLAALADGVGGLTAARFMSMGFMLITTTLCYATARRLWGRPAGWLGAAVFVTTQGTQFLGAFATFDAMALMLIALAAWIAVRSAATATTRSAIYVAIPVLVLANATKYASALYDPVVLALAFFAVLQLHGRRPAIRTVGTMLALLILGLALLVGLAPPEYLTGILSTTLNRATATTPAATVLHVSWTWVGAIGCLAALGVGFAAVLAWRRKGGWAVVGLLAVLAAAVALAPLNQARIQTVVSLSKHVTFGAWFGAVAAGWLLSKVVGWRPRDVWRYPVAASVLVPMGFAGTAQALRNDNWAPSTQVVAALRPLVAHGTGPVLMDDAETARYYLQYELGLPHWQDTFYFSYTPPGSSTSLRGPAAYAAAVDHGYFSVIALSFGQEAPVDRAVATAIHTSKRYQWVGDATTYDGNGSRNTYVIWRLQPQSS